MPDELGPNTDKRTIDDLLNKMLGWFSLQQAPNGPRVPSLDTQGNTPSSPIPPVPLNNPHRAWGGAEQQYPPVDPQVQLEAYEAARKKHGSYGQPPAQQEMDQYIERSRRNGGR